MNRGAEKLKAWRSAKNLSQDVAAAQIGAGQQQWSRWEAGLHRPGARFRKPLKELCGVTADDFDNDVSSASEAPGCSSRRPAEVSGNAASAGVGGGAE